MSIALHTWKAQILMFDPNSENQGPLGLRAPWRTRLSFALVSAVGFVAVKGAWAMVDGEDPWQWSLVRDGIVMMAVYLVVGLVLNLFGRWSRPR